MRRVSLLVAITSLVACGPMVDPAQCAGSAASCQDASEAGSSGLETGAEGSATSTTGADPAGSSIGSSDESSGSSDESSGSTGTAAPEGTSGSGDSSESGGASESGGEDGDESAGLGPECGNGLVEGLEECDDGNGKDTDDCSNACVAAACDDGLRNGDETDVDCGGSCDACGLCASCEVDGDCKSHACGGGECTVRHDLEIDWVNDCSPEGFGTPKLHVLEAGRWFVRAVPSGATRSQLVEPPNSGWVYEVHCSGLPVQEVRTPEGQHYASPDEAFSKLGAYTEEVVYDGGPLVCGVPDEDCADNEGSVRLLLELSCG